MPLAPGIHSVKLELDVYGGQSMMMRRRPLLRAAVVGGGAYYAGKKAAQGSAERAEQDERIGNLEDQQSAGSRQPATGVQPNAAGQPAAVPPAPGMLDQLNQLTTLHQQGALTDDEFAAAKTKLLGTLLVPNRGRSPAAAVLSALSGTPRTRPIMKTAITAPMKSPQT